MGERVRIAIVGGGRMGTPLMMDLLARPFVEIVGLADRDPQSRGAILAQQNDIFFCEDADVLASRGEEIDIIFDLSGDPSVKRSLKDAFVAQDNRTTIILSDLTARLIMSLVADSQELVATVHPDDRGIG